jgi:hypothetical protein
MYDYQSTQKTIFQNKPAPQLSWLLFLASYRELGLVISYFDLTIIKIPSI